MKSPNGFGKTAKIIARLSRTKPNIRVLPRRHINELYFIHKWPTVTRPPDYLFMFGPAADSQNARRESVNGDTENVGYLFVLEWTDGSRDIRRKSSPSLVCRVVKMRKIVSKLSRVSCRFSGESGAFSVICHFTRFISRWQMFERVSFVSCEFLIFTLFFWKF